MSYQLPTAAIAAFDAMVKHAYQASGFDLQKYTRYRAGVTASTLRYPKMGQGQAHLRTAPQTDVVPMNVAHSNVLLTMSDWEAPEYTDIFSSAKVNFEEKTELAQVIAGAMGRRQDQQIIDALVAGTYVSGTNGVTADVGGANTNLNTAKLRSAMTQLDAANVPEDGRVFAYHPNNLSSLLSTTEATSSDFNTVRALVNGEIDTWLGFKFIKIGNRTEGGLPMADASDRECFAWHKSAIAFAENMAKRTTIDWIPTKTSWLCNGVWSAGSIIVDNAGIIQVLCDDDGAAS